MRSLFFYLFTSGMAILLISCRPQQKSDFTPTAAPDISIYSEAVLYDKILGSLVGSGIGDAMGAPTEMWNRYQMQAEYGLIDTLTPHVREPSPEGTWDFNLHSGGTTDDTRWKELTAKFLTATPYPNPLSAMDFASHLLVRYKSYTEEIMGLKSQEPEPYEEALNKILWLKEWTKVAEAYLADSADSHFDALSKFYGGEMVCAGMLFAPTFGAYYPAAPSYAYAQCYKVDIYDLGYARDISGLTAALVSAAMRPNPSKDSVVAVLREVDPQGFFKGRLVGRSSYKFFQQAQHIVHTAKTTPFDKVLNDPPVRLALPLNNRRDSMRYAQWSIAYQLLDEVTRKYPFHPAEIHLVNLVALLLCDFDFRESLTFVVNFGRDNDTTAAVTGAILGAFYGFDALPGDMKEMVILTNREMGIDFEKIAHQMTRKIMSSQNI